MLLPLSCCYNFRHYCPLETHCRAEYVTSYHSLQTWSSSTQAPAPPVNVILQARKPCLSWDQGEGSSQKLGANECWETEAFFFCQLLPVWLMQSQPAYGTNVLSVLWFFFSLLENFLWVLNISGYRMDVLWFLEFTNRKVPNACFY